MRSPVGEASHAFTLPFSEDRLEVLLTRVGQRPDPRTRSAYSVVQRQAAQELGAGLFDALMADDVLICYRGSLRDAESTPDSGLRLRLRSHNAPRLAALPWEFLFDDAQGRFIAQSNRTPVVRYVEMAKSIRPLTLREPLRVLVMVAAPTEHSRLDARREQRLLEQSLAPLSSRGQVHTEFLRDATLDGLRRKLRDERYHVFHFIGHGAYDHREREGILLFEDERGGESRVRGRQLGMLIHDHPSLRLAFLNACETARVLPDDAPTSVAAALVRSGVPAVVAMQFQITDEAAIAFTQEFYAMIAAGDPVNSAVAEGRKACAAIDDVQWATPVLYMRADSGVLFEPSAAASPKRETHDEVSAPIRRRASDNRRPRAQTPTPVWSQQKSRRRPTSPGEAKPWLLRISSEALGYIVLSLGILLLSSAMVLGVADDYFTWLNWSIGYSVAGPFAIVYAQRTIQRCDELIAFLGADELFISYPSNRCLRTKSLPAQWRRRIRLVSWCGIPFAFVGIAMSISDWWHRYDKMPMSGAWWTESAPMGCWRRRFRAWASPDSSCSSSSCSYSRC